METEFLEVASHQGIARYEFSGDRLTRTVARPGRSNPASFSTNIKDFSGEFTISFSGSYFTPLAMWLMLSPMFGFCAALVIFSRSHLEPIHIFAAWVAWAVVLGIVFVRRDVCFTLEYQNYCELSEIRDLAFRGRLPFEVFGRVSERKKIESFIHKILQQSKQTP